MIKILCVGKIKEKFYRDAIEEYMKRLQKYEKVKIIECRDYSNFPVEDILKQEAIELEKNITPKDYVITLEINGNEISSVDLAQKINNLYLSNSSIVFVIGGSYGLHSSIQNRSNYKLSFSKLTFPHQLFRVLLLEQIYRSFKINNNESYHK